METLHAQEADGSANDSRGRGIARALGGRERRVREQELEKHADSERDAEGPELPLRSRIDERSREAGSNEGLAQHEIPSSSSVRRENSAQERNAQELSDQWARPPRGRE